MLKEEFSPSGFLGRSVKEMRPEEQPRERLKKYGAESLSDAELLAILLRTGTKGMNVLNVSRALLSRFDGLRNLSRQNWQSLKVVPGIAGVKAITLEAVFELSRRVQISSLGEKISIHTPEDAAALFSPKLRDLHHEEFYIAFLNNSRVLTGYKRISSGGSTSTIVDVAEIVRQSVMNRANSVIMAHNHPSGYAKESAADIHLTKRVSEALKLMGIGLDDHIIIAGDQFISMRNKNLIG
ncbi:RadC family protein [Rhodohalobacter mucosus]|uniref:JAB domain-containing protein n=1 Tax=Rhodohalobacter mucosus TaxID=2079485 RepID=A0A316TX19_9BACT|nr:DNA repair protein RadC [Rhodohalobacter mucosus]PWN07765.1 JAB domain-containing protein [Rhodohalobacter mucosus]